MTDPLRLLALWALVHESADEAWKAAVTRGRAADAAPEDRLAALVADEKERLHALLTSGGPGTEPEGERLLDELAAIRFELSSLRGRLESIEASLDAMRNRSGEDLSKG